MIKLFTGYLYKDYELEYTVNEWEKSLSKTQTITDRKITSFENQEIIIMIEYS